MPTVTGKYSSNSLGKDKVTEMDRERTRPKTVKDGESFADLVERNSNAESNYGRHAVIKKPRR
jgi:hypothetical protein